MNSIGRFALAVVAATVLAGRADEFYVAPGGSDGNGGTGWTNALATIGEGVAKATGTGPHTVYVSNGTYSITSEIALTNNILVRSWKAGELDEAGTIVDGQSMTRGFRLAHAGAVLAGFTVTNGSDVRTGGGVFIVGGGTVTQCVLCANTSQEGGGICITNRGLVTHSTVRGNVALSNAPIQIRGGGIMLWRYGMVSNCVVSDNTATGTFYGNQGRNSGGGGIALDVDATNHEVRVYGTLVSNNVSQLHGGGIIIRQNHGGLTQVVVSGSTVAGNRAGAAGNGGGIMLAGQYTTWWMGTVTGCVIKGNSTGGLGGGGIHQLMMVRNSTISGNTTSSSGAGGFNVPIFDSLVESNYTTYFGGGLYYTFNGMVVSNCMIRGNTAADSGNCNCGGIMIYCAGGRTVIKNSTIRENVAKGTPGLWTYSTTMTGELYNCLICDNVSTSVASDSRGVVYGTFNLSGCTIVSNRNNWAANSATYLTAGSSVTNCIIYSNRVAGSYGNNLKYVAGVDANIFYTSSPDGLPAGQGNITESPIFKDFDNGDYRVTGDSPTVNAGTNEPWMDGARDLDGRPRIDPFSRRADMGAYEFLPAGALIQLR